MQPLSLLSRATLNSLFRTGVFCAALWALAGPARAALYTVDNTNDTNVGSGTTGTLRWCINQANANAGTDTIVIIVTGTITLTDALPAITESVTISGPSAATLTIDGGSLYRPFSFLSGTVWLEGMTILHGRAKGGNGGNTRWGGGGGGAAGFGGAIFTQTDTTVRNVIFDANTALGGNGGGYVNNGSDGGGGGGGIGGNGADSSGTTVGGNGGSATPLSGTPGTGGSGANQPGTAGGEGAGGGGSGGGGPSGGDNGGAGGFGASGGGGGYDSGNGGTGGYGGGGGAGYGGAGAGGTFGGNGYNYDSGAGGGGGGGLGGAIFVRTGNTRLLNCTFQNNTATGGTGGSNGGGGNNGGNGQGKGGAIFVYTGATVYVGNVTYSSNTAADAGSAADDNNNNYGTLTNVPIVSSIALANSNPTNATSVDFTVTFSTSVTGVNTADFHLVTTGMTGSSIASVNGSGATYTVTVNTGTNSAATGSLQLQVLDDDSITDGANPLGGTGTGNGNYTSGPSYTVDNVGPTIVLSSSAPDPTNAVITVTATLSETSGNFAVGDISATNATVGNFSGSGTSYSFTLTPTADGAVSAVVNAGTFTDGLNNNNTASNTLTRTYDHTGPTITLSSSAAGTVNGPITVTATLNESSGSFAAGDISATNAAVGNFSGSGASYSFTLTPTAEGGFSASVNAGTFTDALGNNNTASNTLTRTYDHTGPTITLSSSAAGTVNGPITVTATLSEDSADFTAADLLATNATISDFSGSGASYSFTLTPTAAGTFSVLVAVSMFTDAAGNANPALAILSRAYDSAAPTVVLANSNPDPTSATLLLVTVTLSEDSADFTADDITATNATVSDFSGSGALYSFTLTPTANGAVSAVVNAGTFTDAAGNGNTASNALTRHYDGTGPTVTGATPAATALTTETSVSFQVTFSEDVSGFDGSDITVNHTGTASSGLTVTPADAFASIYTVTVEGISGHGSFTLSVNATSVLDAAGNPNAAGLTSAVVTVAPPTPDNSSGTNTNNNGNSGTSNSGTDTSTNGGTGAPTNNATSGTDSTNAPAANEETVGPEEFQQQPLFTLCGFGFFGMLPLTLLGLLALKQRYGRR